MSGWFGECTTIEPKPDQYTSLTQMTLIWFARLVPQSFALVAVICSRFFYHPSNQMALAKDPKQGSVQSKETLQFDLE